MILIFNPVCVVLDVKIVCGSMQPNAHQRLPKTACSGMRRLQVLDTELRPHFTRNEGPRSCCVRLASDTSTTYPGHVGGHPAATHAATNQTQSTRQG